MFVVIVFFNQARTDYLVVGWFNTYAEAENEQTYCKTLYAAHHGIEISKAVHAQHVLNQKDKKRAG